MKTLSTLLMSLLLCSGMADGAVSFNEDIRPILADRCFSCHGPDSGGRKADLRLDREEFAKAAIGGSGVIPIVEGKPGESAIMQRLTSRDPDEVMPPPKSKVTVSPAEIELIEEWIADGAEWERHWAFIPPVKGELPDVGDGNWPVNEIDHFILARLEAERLEPAPRAERAQLLRRLSFDLTGLPPSLDELDTLLADGSEQAYRDAVERLMASAAFGERLALEWLDVARYGDTDGLFEDHPRSIYPWRDWVVSAFNENLPYRDFITWQLAGDLLPGSDEAAKIATGFLRNNPTSNEGGIIDEDYRIKYLVDRVNTTSTAFLGLTMECSQCHDHKFDPMTQREYYQMGGFFNSLVGQGNTKGATAPTLRLLPAEKEKRLAAIDDEVASLQGVLGETPEALARDFEEWVGRLEQPVEWETGEVVPSRGLDEKEEKPLSESEVRGRFVRLEHAAERAGFLTVSEVEVFAGGRNVARAGKARQSSDYGAGSKADKAIDGNADGSFGSCACTVEQPGAWWEVDLGSVQAIDHLVVYNRSDCCPERLDQVTVKLLGADREVVAERSIGDAPFRSAFTLNANAALPEAEPDPSETIVSPGLERLAAVRLSRSSPGFVGSLKLEAAGVDGGSRELALDGAAKLKIAQEPVIIGLKQVAELASGERLKITVFGDEVDVTFTADTTAVLRATLPKERDKRLAHFRGIWPGFSAQRAQLDALQKEKGAIEGSAVVTMIASDEAKMRPSHVLMRGEYDKPGEAVEPSAPSSIMAYSPELPRNRLGLARWMVDPANPLTARVAVNRYWQMIFGSGIVLTSEDFGTQGERPSHQALLDYLAVDFVDSGWDVKRLIGKMVSSATYRQASRRTGGIAERDPGNRLLSHAPRRRLQAEFVRDHALAVSGLLVRELGGPGVHPYQPAALFGRNAIGSSNATFKLGSGEDLYRRSLYTYWKRQIPAANMRILGADGRTACRTRRESTNTPLQALVLLNDPQFVEAARVLAERVIEEGGESVEERLAYAFRLSTSREVKPAELAILVAEFNDRLGEFRAAPQSAKAYLAGGGARKPDPGIESVELAAYAAVASLILNLDESISKS